MAVAAPSVSVAAEHGAGYQPGAPEPTGSDPAAQASAASTASDLSVSMAASANSVDGPLDALEGAVERLVAFEMSDLDDPAIRRRMQRVQRCIDRLVAVRTDGAGTLEARALAAAGPGRESQALRTVRQASADELRLSPSQVKRDGETGRQLADRPRQRQAAREGQLPADHARVLADTLRHLDPGPDRDRAEATLLDAARTQDAVTFGRTARRLLAEADHAAAQQAQRRRNARRSLKVAQTTDGMTAIHGQGSGLGAETIATALHAFRRPDAAGEARTTDQVTFDALVDVCRAALDAGTAPTDRGVRPHITVTIDHATLAGDGAGVAETTWSGPLPWLELRGLLADAGVARLLVDARSVPLEASAQVRTVPAGLWRALLHRDRTCIGERCTVPASWCQVMHLHQAYRLDGRLSIDNAALGCSYHHRMLDQHGWDITWRRGRPTLHRPGSGPPPGREPPDAPEAPEAPDAPDAPDAPTSTGSSPPPPPPSGPEPPEASDLPEGPGLPDAPGPRSSRPARSSRPGGREA